MQCKLGRRRIVSCGVISLFLSSLSSESSINMGADFSPISASEGGGGREEEKGKKYKSRLLPFAIEITLPFFFLFPFFFFCGQNFGWKGEKGGKLLSLHRPLPSVAKFWRPLASPCYDEALNLGTFHCFVMR